MRDIEREVFLFTGRSGSPVTKVCVVWKESCKPCLSQEADLVTVHGSPEGRYSQTVFKGSPLFMSFSIRVCRRHSHEWLVVSCSTCISQPAVLLGLPRHPFHSLLRERETGSGGDLGSSVCSNLSSGREWRPEWLFPTR